MLKTIIKNYCKKKEYDIVVSGCGITGLTFALNLQKHSYFKENKKILWVDKFDLEKNTINYENNLQKDINEHIPNQRVFTLSEYSMNFINNLNLKKLDNSRISNFNEIIVSNKNDDSKINFIEDKNKNLAYVLENDHLIYSLYNEIKDLNVDIKLNSEINSIKNKGKNYELKINDEVINSKMIIGSEGNNSQVAKLSNIHYNGYNYNQKAIVCTIKLEDQIEFGFQKFLETGPFAILPLWDNYASLIWSLDNYEFANKILKTDEEITEMLNFHLKNYNIVVKEISNKRLSFPLKNLSANSYVKDNIVLIGDAAHSIHPMAGQGLNLGLSDSYNLSNGIIESLNLGQDITNEKLLKNYEYQSKFNTSLMQYGLDFIKLSFENKNPKIEKLRDITLNVLDKLPLKKIFKDISSGKSFYNNSIL